eukprot:456081-Prymnesium_polylepis.2
MQRSGRAALTPHCAHAVRSHRAMTRPPRRAHASLTPRRSRHSRPRICSRSRRAVLTSCSGFGPSRGGCRRDVQQQARQVQELQERA